MPGHSYKLTYGEARGLAEIVRYVLAAAGVDYEDERLTPEQFQAKKKDTPFKQYPVLAIDGKMFCQGPAVSRYLAREHGLMGISILEALRIEEIVECMTDGKNELTKLYYEKDDKKKAEIKEKFMTEFVPKLLDFLTMRLKENKGGKAFFVGDKLSYADLFVFDAYDIFKPMLQCDVFASNELLKTHNARVAAEPRIAAWIQKRPKTDY